MAASPKIKRKALFSSHPRLENYKILAKGTWGLTGKKFKKDFILQALKYYDMSLDAYRKQNMYGFGMTIEVLKNKANAKYDLEQYEEALKNGRWGIWLLPPATKLRQGNIFTSVCQGFCPQEGAVRGRGACVAGGMHGRGVCGSGRLLCGRGYAWQGACMAGDMHGRGACMAGGACMTGGTCVAGRCAWQEKRQLQQAVHILLECILVTLIIHTKLA